MGRGIPDEENRGLVPEIVPTGQKLRVGQWAMPVTARQFFVIKAGCVLALLSFAGWLLQNFFQLRGVVDLLVSRIDLGFLWLCLFLVGWAVTFGFNRKGLMRAAIGVVALAVVIGLDVWAPKPKTVPLSLAAMPTTTELARETASEVSKILAPPVISFVRTTRILFHHGLHTKAPHIECFSESGEDLRTWDGSTVIDQDTIEYKWSIPVTGS